MVENTETLLRVLLHLLLLLLGLTDYISTVHCNSSCGNPAKQTRKSCPFLNLNYKKKERKH